MRCLLALGLVGCATAGSPSNPMPDSSNQQHLDAPAGKMDAPMQQTDAPSNATCNSGITCAQAMNLGQIDADQNADTKTATGYESAWFSIRAHEGDSSVLAAGMKVTINLTSPAGENFDLYAYMNTGTDVVECTTVSASSTNTTGTDQVHLTWGESGTFSNGADDSRTISIEVRPVSGTCTSSNTYTLVVYGDL